MAATSTSAGAAAGAEAAGVEGAPTAGAGVGAASATTLVGAIGDDGAFYVANYSAAAGRGEVLRIAAIPEPATWALMIGGFGLVGGALRRRRPGSVTA